MLGKRRKTTYFPQQSKPSVQQEFSTLNAF
jgi:hypothetical protein